MTSATDLTPTTQTELARYLAENAALSTEVGDESDVPRRPRVVCPVGGRTSLQFGQVGVRPELLLSTSALARVVDYPARDMTITVEAGLRIEELAERLRVEKQQLPIDVPQAHRATVGGAVASNVSGPRRFGYGTFRDYVIGLTAVDGMGRLFHSGGRVVKNVAGYDLCKLLVGSHGTLAVITQVTFKLKPIPDASAWWWGTFESFAAVDAALQRLTTSQTRPAAIEVLSASAARQLAVEAQVQAPATSPVLAILVDGAAATVQWQLDTLTSELASLAPRQLTTLTAEGAAAMLQALTEFPVCADEPVTFQATLLPSRTAEFLELASKADCLLQAHAANGVVIGHLPEQVGNATAAAKLLEPLRRFARLAHGHLVLTNAPADWKDQLSIFGEPAADWPLMQRVKQALDPHGVLNPGKFLDRP